MSTARLFLTEAFAQRNAPQIIPLDKAAYNFKVRMLTHANSLPSP